MMRIVMILVIAVIDVSNGEFPRFQQPTKADGSLQVLVVGDWGRKGHYNQSQLAHQVYTKFTHILYLGRVRLQFQFKMKIIDCESDEYVNDLSDLMTENDF